MSACKLNERDKAIVLMVRSLLADYGLMLKKNADLLSDKNYYSYKAKCIKSGLGSVDDFRGSTYNSKEDLIIKYMDKCNDIDKKINENIFRFLDVKYAVDQIEDKDMLEIVNKVWIKDVKSLSQMADVLHFSYGKVWLLSNEALLLIYKCLVRVNNKYAID